VDQNATANFNFELQIYIAARARVREDTTHWIVRKFVFNMNMWTGEYMAYVYLFALIDCRIMSYVDMLPVLHIIHTDRMRHGICIPCGISLNAGGRNLTRMLCAVTKLTDLRPGQRYTVGQLCEFFVNKNADFLRISLSYPRATWVRDDVTRGRRNKKDHF